MIYYGLIWFARLQMKCCSDISWQELKNNKNNDNLHLCSANLYMDIFSCVSQYFYIKFILKVTKT